MLLTKKNFSDLPWRLLSVEAMLVVASIFLALALENWRENLFEDRLAERALQEFVDEVQTNCGRMRSIHPYHESVASGERAPEGIQIGLLRNDAWDVAKNTGAAPHLDYDLVVKIVEISAMQGDHRAIVQAYTQALFARVLESEKTEQWHVAGERGVIRELVRIQADLLEKYENLLHSVDQEYTNSINTQGACQG